MFGTTQGTAIAAAVEPGDVKMEEGLNSRLGSSAVYYRSQEGPRIELMATFADGDQQLIPSLLLFTETILREGHTLKSEIEKQEIPIRAKGLQSDSQQPEELVISESHKHRFMAIVAQFVFALQQSLLVFPELFGARSTFRSKALSLTHQLPLLLRLHMKTRRRNDSDCDNGPDIEDPHLIQSLLFFNRQKYLACTKLSTMMDEGGPWVTPKSRVYFYKFFLDLYRDSRWRDIMKMSQKTFLWLCEKMGPHIRKCDTNYRNAIPVPCRLAACIYKLVTGCRSADIMSKFGIGRSTLYSILRQVIPGIIEVLGGNAITWPTTGDSSSEQQQFHETTSCTAAAGIQEVCSLPNCWGVIGRCDIPIVAPTEDPWAYMNVTQEYSVVLQAVCDHQRKFTFVNVGKAGSMDNEWVLRSSSLFGKAESGALFLKSDHTLTLPSGSELSPYLIGGHGYPCLNWLMTPYSSSSSSLLGPREALYNEKLLQGKALVDQSFAILRRTFAELAAPCLLDIDLVPEMIGACCVLHNILVDKNDVQVGDLQTWMKASRRRADESGRKKDVMKTTPTTTSGTCEFEADHESEEYRRLRDLESPTALMKRDTLATCLMNHCLRISIPQIETVQHMDSSSVITASSDLTLLHHPGAGYR